MSEKMETSVILALISAFVATFVAVISSITTIIINRRSEKYKKELEEYKTYAEQQVKSESFKREDINNRIKILGQTCKFIQILRDDIRLLSEMTQPDLDITKQIHASSSDLVSLYQNSHYLFVGIEKKILHDVKNIALIFESVSKLFIENKQNKLNKLTAYTDSLQSAQDFMLLEISKWNKLVVNIPQNESDQESYFQPGPHHHYLDDLRSFLKNKDDKKN